MAFFSALCKIIAESGGPYVLQESEALAKGSINGFLSGKNNKRCKRMHEILSLAMEILHFESFLQKQDDQTDIEATPMHEIELLKSESNSKSEPSII